MSIHTHSFSIKGIIGRESWNATVRPCRRLPVICELFAVLRELIRRNRVDITDDVLYISRVYESSWNNYHIKTALSIIPDRQGVLHVEESRGKNTDTLLELACEWCL